jgi:hypothetical protein
MRLLGERKRMSSLVYFSHSYRPRDALVNNYFARLMESEGLVASLDPPSGQVNSAKLERHLGNCEAMVSVLTEREDGVSPHILYEISLGLRSGKPVLVFVEDTLPPDIVPAYVLQRRFSLRSFPRNVREHRQALGILQAHIGNGVPRIHGLLAPRSCLLLGAAALEPEAASAVARHLRTAQHYEVVSGQELIEDLHRHPIAYGRLREFSLILAFLEPEHDREELQLLGEVRGTFVPTISFARQPRRPDDAVPAEYRSRLVDPGIEAGALLELISAEIEIYEADFLDLQDEASADRYTQFLIDLDSRGRYTPRTTERAVEVVLGDRYEVHGQAGAIGPNSHAHDLTLQQVWSENSGQIDLPALAGELARLRSALRERASTAQEDQAVADVAQAEISARRGDGPGALRSLRRAGKWALDTAVGIGVDVATAAITSALGFK